ncbi:hypothetical protein Tco_1416088 [Tanacetum coccineum]
MSLVKAWDDTINKLKVRLSRWKLKTLSIGGRLTLLKSVLGSTPIYNMSLYKVPKAVLNSMEAIRRDFFNGIPDGERKIAWVKWTKVLASKNQGGLGASRWKLKTLSIGGRLTLLKSVLGSTPIYNMSLYKVPKAVLNSMEAIRKTKVLSASHSSSWSFIIKEINTLKAQGVDLISIVKSELVTASLDRLPTRYNLDRRGVDDKKNQLLFAAQKPRKEALFDDIVMRSFNWSIARGKLTFRWIAGFSTLI